MEPSFSKQLIIEKSWFSERGKFYYYTAKMTKLTIEFPMSVLATYNGGLDNLDVTLDDNLTYYLRMADPVGEVLDANRFPAEPNRIDEFYRYSMSYKNCDESEVVSLIVKILSDEGYLRGCTIKSDDGCIIRSDEATADIIERRRIKDCS